MNERLLIATHDSATGEASPWWAWPLLPFARTQGKSLVEQYGAGCRLFDIRVRRHKGQWYAAHGLWRSKRPLMDLLSDLEARVIEAWKESGDPFKDIVYVSLTYEGSKPDLEAYEFLYQALYHYHSAVLILTYAAVKYGKRSKGARCKYDYVWRNKCISMKTRQGFLPLDGRSWHTYLPLPWLWDRLYKRPHEFNTEEYTYVDFL